MLPRPWRSASRLSPLNYDLLPPEERRGYDRFLELATIEITAPLPIQRNYRFATYVKTDEERSRMSAEWVRQHSREEVIAMTLETSWNTPHSTTDGYRAVGSGLARTVAEYLAE